MPTQSRRFFVRERKTNVNFLIDTGSDCSLLPAIKQERNLEPIQVFMAANGTPINVYPHKPVSFDIGLHKQIAFPFLYVIFLNLLLGQVTCIHL